ncbi:MAG: alginate export family protein [Phycisphaerae bacterium]|nr:alginate export family protein [Phycisphaerae bacterium]
MSRRKESWIGPLGVLVIAGLAFGQDEQRRIERAVRTADPAMRERIDSSLSFAERSYLEVGGFLSTTFVNLNDSNDNSRRYFSPEISIYGRAVIDGAHTFFGRARFQYREFSQGDSFDDRGDRWGEPFVDRWWYEFDLKAAKAAYDGKTIDGNLNIRVGRQFVDWGSGLTLSENLYAFRPTIEAGRFTVDGLAGITPGDQSVTDFDASRGEFNEETWRGFFGGRFAYRTKGNEEFYAFVLAQVDYNEDGPSRPNLGFQVDHEYNSQYFGIGSTGSLFARLLYTGEFVYEIGDSQSDPLRGPQQEEDIQAWAARGDLTYLFADRNNSRAEFETIFASGDRDRLVTSDTVGGNLAGTSDHAFNSMGFVNTGLAFAPSLSNIMTFRFGASTYPFPEAANVERLQVGADLFFLNKLDPKAPIDEPTSRDYFLGVETDFYVNYRVTSDLAFSLRYGVFFPSAAVETEKDTRQFIFLGMTLSF